MSVYYEENKVLLDKLQNETKREEIHGVIMEVKGIPDPIEETVLDPRVYRQRLAESQKEDEMAQCLEIPVEMIRKDPGYPNRDVTEGGIKSKEYEIETRNGKTKIHVYTPKGGQAEKPAVLFFHGGAFIAGSTKVVENFCRLLAALSDAVVIGVDYRLAPEHRFPAGLYDCYDAVGFACEHAKALGIRKDKIMVAGDSAGGTLAIGCCLLEREEGKHRICYEALLYPGVLVDNFKMEDYKWRMSEYEIPDTDMLAMGAAVSLKAMTAEMPLLYMGKEGHVKDPLAAPLCQESLEGLPKTLLALCEYDYLRLSGEAFARKLHQDQADLRTLLYKGMDHAFIDKTGDYPQAYDLAVEIAKDIKNLCAN